MGLLPFLFFPLEIYLFFRVAGTMGFFAALLIYWAPCLLGTFILRLQSRTAMAQMQEKLKRGESSVGVLGLGANFFAGLLLLLPFLSTRVLALVLLLPGTRQLTLFLARAWIIKKLANGTFVFAGRGFPGGPYNAPVERDATVIDVEAVEIMPGELSAPKKPE